MQLIQFTKFFPKIKWLWLSKKIFKNEKAFTLIELLVVVSIISLLSVLVVFNQGQSQTKLRLERTSYQIAQNIRRTEEMAIAAQFFQGSYPFGGFGIFFMENENSYIIFADVDNNQTYSPNEFIEEINLENFITIEKLLPVSPLLILFKAPDPEVIFPAGAITASIKLIADGIDNEKTILINSLGVIEIQ